MIAVPQTGRCATVKSNRTTATMAAGYLVETMTGFGRTFIAAI